MSSSLATKWQIDCVVSTVEILGIVWQIFEVQLPQTMKGSSLRSHPERVSIFSRRQAWTSLMVPEGMASWAWTDFFWVPFWVPSWSGFLDELDPEEAKLSLEADQRATADQSSQIPLT